MTFSRLGGCWNQSFTLPRVHFDNGRVIIVLPVLLQAPYFNRTYIFHLSSYASALHLHSRFIYHRVSSTTAFTFATAHTESRLTTHYPLPTTHYSLLTTHYS